MRTTRLFAASAATLLILAACGEADTTDAGASAEETTPASEPEDSAPAEETEVETSESAEETSEDEEEEEDAGDSASGGATFGEKHEISDRMAVTVSEPEEFTPGEYAFVEGDWDVFVSMDVTLENIGDEPVESMELMTRATSGSQEAEPIFDTDSGLDMPTAVVQPGRELEFTMGYGVNSGEPFDLTVEDMMDFESTGVTLSTTID